MGVRMRVILQDTSTNLFYQGGVEWGVESATAHDFGSSLNAIDFCLENQFRHGEIVLCFANPIYNIRLSASPEPAARRATSVTRGKHKVH